MSSLIVAYRKEGWGDGEIQIRTEIRLKNIRKGGPKGRDTGPQGSFEPLHRYNLGKHGGFCAFDPLH